jgi:muconate cycloisomerase
MDLSIDAMEPAKAAVDMALYDIVGKWLGVPIHVLLGGQVREHIPLSFSIMFASPDEMAGFASELVADGFKTVKVKVGQGANTDEAAIRAIRHTVGDGVNVRVDANMAWKTPKEALETLRRIEPFGIELAEQPLIGADLDGMAFIRERTDIPIMADESVWSPRTAMQVLKREAADIVSVYVSEAGGLFRAAQIFSMCEAAGVPNAIGSMPETGVGTAAEVHLGVAMANLAVAADCCGSIYYDEDFLKTPLEVRDGFARPPQTPGLGVEIDEEVFTRWCEAG